MRVIDQTGDSTLLWDVEDEQSVREAEALFEDLARRCHIPFARAAGAPASDAERVRSFDPTAEEIIWVRPVVGG